VASNDRRKTLKIPKNVVYDSSDPDQIQKATDTEKDRERDLIDIMKLPRGRRWMYDLIYGSCHVSMPSHYPSDTHTTAYNEGARAVGNKVLEELRTNHFSAFITMLEEHHDPVE
jgi:hypothetical protein